MQRRPLAVIASIFFLSGASSLVYETAWTRVFQDLFGHSVHTTAAVLAAFMAGLGLGSWVVGSVGDRLRRPLLAYGILELALALLVVVSPWMVHAVDRQLSAVLWFSQPGGAATVARWLLAFLLLVIPTSLMGATLPLLCRAAAGDDEGLTRVVGSLYGANTAGAVLGVLAAAYWLIRYLGVTASIRAGCVLGLLAGGGALLLSRLLREGETATGTLEAQPLAAERPATPAWVVLVMLGAGFAAMAAELVWIRHFVLVIGSNLQSFALVLATLLLAFAAGSALLPRLLRTAESPLRTLGWVQLALGLSIAATVLLFARLTSILRLTSALGGTETPLESMPARVLLVIIIVAPPGLLMGAVLPAASAGIGGHRVVSRGVGSLYAATCVGNIAGALAAGYLLVPAVGCGRSLVLLAALSVTLGLVVLVHQRAAGLVVGVAAAAIGAAVLASLWFFVAPGVARAAAEVTNGNATFGFVHEGLRGTVTVHDVPPIPLLAANRRGPLPLVGQGYRLIAVDGVEVAGTAPDLQTTQRMQADIPLLLHGPARRVLQVGYGSGTTTREGLLYGPEVFHLVELNPEVIAQASRWFPELAAGGYAAFFTDAKNFIRTTHGRYDVILNDSTYPGVSGSSQLYSLDHFIACREHLNPGGVVSTWLPIDLPPETFRMVLATFHSAFPHSSFWLPANCLNKHGVLVGSLEPQGPMLARLLASSPPERVKESLTGLGYGDRRLFASMQVLGEEEIASLSEGVALNSDDRPLLEFPARGVDVAGEEFWSETLKLILHELGPPGRSSAGDDRQGVPGLLADCVRHTLSAEVALLTGDPEMALQLARRAQRLWPTHPGPIRLQQDVLAFRADVAFDEAMSALRANNPQAAFEPLSRAVALYPDSASAQFELGRMLLFSGKPLEAATHLEACRQLAASIPSVEVLLGDAYASLGQPDRAEAHYRQYLAANPPRVEVAVALASVIGKQGRSGEALQLLDELRRQGVEDESALKLREQLSGQPPTAAAPASAPTAPAG